MTVPVISITDLSCPPEDPGEHLDLILAYGLPELDLRAVILDGRDPGVTSVTKLNAIFGRDVPVAWGPSTPMRDTNDRMYDAPPPQQRGVDLLIHAVADSPEPVHLLSFGSARPMAVAYNRAPEVFHEKVARIHLSGHAVLDPQALVRISDAGLPLSHHSCSWELPDLKWVEEMHPWLRRYLGSALSPSTRPNCLRALDDDASAEVMADIYHRRCPVRTTALWLEVSGRQLVRRTDGSHAIVPATEVWAGVTVIPNEQALNEALPALYQSLIPSGLS